MSGKTTINIDELLQKFVSTDEQRSKFMKPWRERNQIFASETHILIRVSGYLTNTDYPQYNSDNSNKLFPKGLPDGILTAATLENAISYAPLIDEIDSIGKYIECKECDGTGEVEWEYQHWTKGFDCPVCHGTGYSQMPREKATGKKIIDPESSIKIGQQCFQVGFLKLILEAMGHCACTQATVTFGTPTSATRFNLTDEIDIILMPTNQKNAYKTIHLTNTKP